MSSSEGKATRRQTGQACCRAVGSFRPTETCVRAETPLAQSIPRQRRRSEILTQTGRLNEAQIHMKHTLECHVTLSCMKMHIAQR